MIPDNLRPLELQTMWNLPSVTRFPCVEFCYCYLTASFTEESRKITKQFTPSKRTKPFKKFVDCLDIGQPSER